MSKFKVPPLDPQFELALESIVEAKQLDDDEKWKTSLLPLLLDRVEAIETAVREYSAEPKSPLLQTLNEVTRTLVRVKTHLQDNFSSAAPFTIRRIAEILVQYDQSEYSLATVSLAHKYVLALARLVCVQSRETQFRDVLLSETEHKGTNGNDVSQAENDEHGLPKDVKYTRLLWTDTPITETLMVKDKADLLKKVAEKVRTGENGSNDEERKTEEDCAPVEVEGRKQGKGVTLEKKAKDFELMLRPGGAAAENNNDATLDSTEAPTRRASREREEPKCIKVQELVNPVEPETLELDLSSLLKRARLD